MESSCEQMLKWTEKVLNGGAITEEEARTLIRAASGRQLNLRSLQFMALAGGMNGVMIGNYLTSKGSDPQDDIVMLHDLGRTRTAPQVSCVEG